MLALTKDSSREDGSSACVGDSLGRRRPDTNKFCYLWIQFPINAVCHKGQSLIGTIGDCFGASVPEH
jgi:hypothetical protein